MPFVDPEEVGNGGGFALQERKPPDTSPTVEFRELFDSALRISEAGSLASSVARGFERSQADAVPGYDPFADIEGYEDFADEFIDVESPQESAIVKRYIDKKLNAKRSLAEGGIRGVAAQLAALPADPSMLIPIAGGTRLALRFGEVTRGAVEGARLGLLGGVAHEAIIQGLDETQTAAESAINIAASTILTAGLGAGIGAVAGRRIPGVRDLDALERAVADDLEGNIKYSGDFASSVGAAEARATTLQQEAAASAFGVERLSQQDYVVGTPLARTLNSPSVEVRRIAGDLAETPLIQNKNREGIASSQAVETRTKGWHYPLAEAISEMDRQFLLYRTGKEVDTGTVRGRVRLATQNVKDLTGKSVAEMTYREFRQEVAKAMRREDSHPVPQVAAAAKAYRASLFEPLKKEAIDLGLLPEDVSVDTALSYLTRLYDTPKIIAQRPEFEGRLTRWLARQRDEVAARTDEAEQGLQAARTFREGAGPKIEALREAQKGLKERVAEAKKVFGAVDRELKLRDQRLRKIGNQLKKARERVEKIRPEEPLAKDHPLVEAINDAKAGVKPPPSLVQWLAAHGGLRPDDGGEVAALGLRPGTKGVPVGAVRKDGMTLDDAARAAWDAGYIGREGERPGIDELIDAIRDDMGGAKVYSQQDFDELARYEAAQSMAREIEQRGLDINRMSTDELAYRLSYGPAEDIPPYRKNTAARRSKVREAEYAVRRLEKELASEAESLRKVQERWDELDMIRRDDARKASGLAKEQADLEKRMNRAGARIERLESLIENNRIMAGMEDAELAGVASEITDTLIGGAPNRVSYLPIPLKRGPLKERTLNISDYEIEDFLVNDIETVARSYARTMGADVELTRAFGRADMQDQITKINEDYARRRDGVNDQATLTKLEKQRQSDIRDIEGMRDRIRGTYGIPTDPSSIVSRIGRTTLELNYLRLLGGMTISAIPDIGRTVMMHGFSRVAGQGLGPMVRNFKAYKLAADEVKRAGTALDMVLDTRALQMSEIWDDFGRFSKFERGVTAAANNFGLVSAMAPWNTFWKQFSGVLSQTRTLEAVEAIVQGKASANEIERLAWLGIDDVGAQKIAAEFSRHGKKDGGAWWANTSAWTDREAADAFRNAIIKEVDTSIVTPGAGDRPLWMSSELGKIIGQFRSFSMSSMTKVATLGLQKRDRAALEGLVFSVSLGMLSTYFKQLSSGQPLPETPEEWIIEGVDRSGVTGWLMDANNTLEKVAGIGLNPLLGTGPVTRYSSRGAAGAVLGPTFGAVFDDAVPTARNALTGEFSASDTHRLRKLLPYQNLFYVRGLFNQIEEGTNEAFGIPDRRRNRN